MSHAASTRTAGPGAPPSTHHQQVLGCRWPRAPRWSAWRRSFSGSASHGGRSRCPGPWTRAGDQRRCIPSDSTRFDVSVAVRNALARRDPGTARLLTAVGASLGRQCRARSVATSTALVRLVFRRRLSTGTGSPLWSTAVTVMLAAAKRADPGMDRPQQPLVGGPRAGRHRALPPSWARRLPLQCSPSSRTGAGRSGGWCDRGHGGGGGPWPLARLDGSSTALRRDRFAGPLLTASRRAVLPSSGCCVSAPQTAPATIAAMSCAIRALASPGRKWSSMNVRRAPPGAPAAGQSTVARRSATRVTGRATPAAT